MVIIMSAVCPIPSEQRKGGFRILEKPLFYLTSLYHHHNFEKKKKQIFSAEETTSTHVVSVPKVQNEIKFCFCFCHKHAII